MKKLYFILIGFLVFGGVEGQIINFPDANFKAKLLSANSSNQIVSTDTPDVNGNVATYTSVDTNMDGQIQISEALAIKWLDVSASTIADLTGIQSFASLRYLNCNSNQLQSLNVSGLANLQIINCSVNQIANLDLSGLTNLHSLDCSNNQLTSINVIALTNLYFLKCYANQLQSLNVSGLVNLQIIDCSVNQITNLYLSGLTYLNTLICSNNQLPSIDVTGLTILNYLDCSSNQLPSLNVSGLTNLQSLSCYTNQLTSINVTGLTNLQYFVCSNNLLPSLNVSGLTNLQTLGCSNNQLPTIDVSGLTNLQSLACSENQLPNIDVSGLTSLHTLSCSFNQLPSLDVSGLTNLQILDCAGNQLPSLNVSGLTSLQALYCQYNLLPSIDVNGLTNLQSLYCGNNQLTTLNVSNLSSLSALDCSSNQLNTLFIKNGSIENTLDFSNNANLQYICADDGQVAAVQTQITSYGYTNCHVNSYCSFTPGGTFYTIQGNNHYDSNNNGCTPTDINYPNLKLAFTDGTNSGNLISNTTGAYHYDMQSGTQTITPTVENPTYFNVSPTTATVTFPTTVSPHTQDFCITANGVHNDLEIALLPIIRARPGFDATYKIIYKNKGTSTQSGTVNLAFNDAVLDYVSATPSVSVQTLNNLTWNFSNLAPFETRVIDVFLNLNSPVEVPPLNSGDILNYNATVTGLADETPIDNTAILNQTVVNAFDPNYKTCTEGETVAPNMAGKYVHYMIGFENTGTANAQNIVVKDIIDTTKYDITTLVPIKGSDPFTTRITNTNQVEFIFQNINLPFTTGSNDGYVAFKIKTKPTLVLGDTFSNTANIYFDYNAPIVTNTATTTIAALVNPEFVFTDYFTLSPIPTKGVLNINIKQDITISSISIYNTLGQVVSVTSNPSNTIDVSSLTTGSYFIKVITDKGTSSGKFMKE